MITVKEPTKKELELLKKSMTQKFDKDRIKKLFDKSKIEKRKQKQTVPD